ncbi:hypothetical protein [Ruminococcus sp. Marseille-P6503]|uniref:hypothetical protein n=1 Tax=Ruminococcus sp. Marseille-P6503 TaxID=2364796 RepID=UPI000F547DAB|nr:hypothetical protein [Ruminococcus sp. Marseille-P6503]
MAKRSKAKQDIVDAARRMPPLYHKLPDEDFEYKKARTLWWLVKQNAILKYIWDIIKQSGAVKYDPSVGKWQGVDFESEDDDD